MIASQFLSRLSELGFRISISKDQKLNFKGPKGALSPEFKESLRLYRQELLDELRVRAAVEEALRIFPGARVIDSPHPPRGRQAFCGYPEHAVTDWKGEPGHWICGICHPNPRNAYNNRQNMEDNRKVGRRCHDSKMTEESEYAR
jgi:hypothetical protein